MTVWKLLYENRFRRHAETGATLVDVRRAAAGTQSVRSGPVFLLFAALPGLSIGRGRNLVYQPAAPLREVIGVDLALEVALVGLAPGRPLPLATTDTGGLAVELEVVEQRPAGETLCRLLVRVGATTVAVEGLRLRRRFAPGALERRRLQVRWTTQGQLQVWLDGALIAYENAVVAGHSFTLERLAVGDRDEPTTLVVDAVVGRLRLVELREDSAAAELDRQLGFMPLPEVSTRCAEAARVGLGRLMRGARELMAAFDRSQTTPWRPEQGGSPFSSSALAVHTAADEAAVAFGRFVHRGAPESGPEVVARLRTLLDLLAADQPKRLVELVRQGRDLRRSLSGDCGDAVNAVRELNPQLLARLEPLNAEVEAILDRLAGGV